MKPIAVNFHLWKPCDARCVFCFATFRDVRGALPLEDARRLIEILWAAGAEKLNFAGGEPTLHPHIGELVRHAKDLGFVTSVVTNGSRLGRLLEEHANALDWVGLSVDSSVEEVQQRLGRGCGDHVASSIRLADRCRGSGVRVKLNTVVTALTWEEDMSDLVRQIAPERWKVFQVLRVVGQNDGCVEPVLVTALQFRSFVDRHAHLAAEGFAAVAEDNDAMTDSYVMIDPLGRCYGDAGGVHRVSRPILDVGLSTAIAEVGFDARKFLARGGRYAW